MRVMPLRRTIDHNNTLGLPEGTADSIGRANTKNHCRDERGFITPKMALGLGIAGVMLTAGALRGSVGGGIDLMTGSVSATEPLQVQILSTEIKQELCIANATVKVNTSLTFEGYPLDADLKGKFLGLVDYNLNLERNYSAELYRKVRYCMEGMSIPYQYDPNIAFGSGTTPAITAKVKLSDIIVIVSALHDGRDHYDIPTSDGVLGFFASNISAFTQQKTVQNLIGKELAQSVDAQGQIDSMMNGTQDAVVDQAAATECLKPENTKALKPEDGDYNTSPIGKLIVQAGKEAIQKNFFETDNNRPQPGLDDISFTIENDINVSGTADIINQTKNDNMESAVNLLTKSVADGGEKRQITVAGIPIDITYHLDAPVASAGQCVVNAESEATSLTSADKGEG